MYHKIEVKQKPGTEGQPLTGANCEIFIDGKQFKGARSFKLEVDAKSLGIATIEVYGHISVDMLGHLKTVDLSPRNG